MQSDVCAGYVHSHSGDGARGEARSRRFWAHSHWVIDGIRVPCPCEQLLGRNMQLLLSQRKQSNPTYFTPQLRTGSWGFYSKNWGADCPWKRYDNLRSKRRTCLSLVHVLDSTVPNTHCLIGDNGQHTLWGDVSGIHTKSTPHTKSIQLKCSTQRNFNIKSVLQDLSRWIFLLNS